MKFHPKDKACCIVGVWGDFIQHQCQRKRGYGYKKLYCKQHDPERIRKKEVEKQKIYNEKVKNWEEVKKRYIIIQKL